MTSRAAALLAAGVLFLAGCQDSGQFKPYEPHTRDKSWTLGGTEVVVEVAANDQARQTGLMYRDQMPDDHGMLFLYLEPRILSFWMRNTYIPLDIAFIKADGTITNIEPMQPLQETPPTTSLDKVPYALEMNQGWFAAHGVKAGDKLTIPDWVAAVAVE